MTNISVNLVIKNSNDKYILQLRDGTAGICNPLKWNFFGGRLDHSENPVDGALREFKEETSITLNKNDLKLIGEITRPDGNGIVFLFQVVRPIEMNEIVLSEGAGIGNFTTSEILQMDITDLTKLAILTYL